MVDFKCEVSLSDEGDSETPSREATVRAIDALIDHDKAEFSFCFTNKKKIQLPLLVWWSENLNTLSCHLETCRVNPVYPSYISTPAEQVVGVACIVFAYTFLR